jgi:hypothetical protein
MSKAREVSDPRKPQCVAFTASKKLKKFRKLYVLRSCSRSSNFTEIQDGPKRDFTICPRTFARNVQFDDNR